MYKNWIRRVGLVKRKEHQPMLMLWYILDKLIEGKEKNEIPAEGPYDTQMGRLWKRLENAIHGPKVTKIGPAFSTDLGILLFFFFFFFFWDNISLKRKKKKIV